MLFKKQMDLSLTDTGRNIARNLSNLRKNRGLSQLQVANLAGITRASVALLESGSANPTLEILLKVCRALRVSLDEFISPPRAECRLIKAVDVPVDRRSKNGVLLRKLLPEKIPATEMDELRLEPGALLTGSPHIEGTREYFTCTAGEISVGVLGAVHVLHKGDVLSFPGDKPHSYKNTGRSAAAGVSVVFFSSPV